jgi:broad-specificity NMP kinase
MKRILITGMSGTGKTSVIKELHQRGYDAIETDDLGWCAPERGDWASHDSEWIWNEERIGRLLDAHRSTHLFVSGCRPNQGRFYDRFDRIVLLSAPPEVMFDRIASRTTNPYGKRAEEWAQILDHLEIVQPMLRATSDIEIDTAAVSLDDVVTMLIALTEDDS